MLGSRRKLFPYWAEKELKIEIQVGTFSGTSIKAGARPD
jgi:hypothetical protein